MKQPLPSTIDFWKQLVLASSDLMATIEDALLSNGLPPLSWYDALLEVEKAGSAGVRPFELQERLLLPQSGTSRLLQRMEQAGYIARLDCKADGRGYVVVVTKEGKATRRRMWPIYADVLIDGIETRLSDDRIEDLTDALKKTRGV